MLSMRKPASCTAFSTCCFTMASDSSVSTLRILSETSVFTCQRSTVSKAFKNGVTDLMQLPQLMLVLNCSVFMLFSFC